MSAAPGFPYKLLAARDWVLAQQKGVIAPAPIDSRDGYIHLSTAAQVLETARRHFAEEPDVVAVEIDPAKATGEIRYETAPSRGEIFPHLYGALPLAAVIRVRPLRRRGAGFVFADDSA